MLGIFISLFLSLNFAIHDVHVSKTMLKYKEELRSWQMTMYVYVDDLEESMRIMGMDSLQILTEKEYPNVDQKIDTYLDSVLQVTVDGQRLNFNVLGKENGDEYLGIWIYAEVLDADQPKSIEIVNNLILNLYTDQRNMMQIKVGDWAKYALMDLSKTKLQYQLP